MSKSLFKYKQFHNLWEAHWKLKLFIRYQLISSQQYQTENSITKFAQYNNLKSLLLILANRNEGHQKWLKWLIQQIM